MQLVDLVLVQLDLRVYALCLVNNILTLFFECIFDGVLDQWWFLERKCHRSYGVQLSYIDGVHWFLAYLLAKIWIWSELLEIVDTWGCTILIVMMLHHF